MDELIQGWQGAQHIPDGAQVILGIVEDLTLAPFTLLEEPGEQLAFVIGEATDGLTAPQQMLGLGVLAISFGDGDQMVQAIVAEGGVPSGMAPNSQKD